MSLAVKNDGFNQNSPGLNQQTRGFDQHKSEFNQEQLVQYSPFSRAKNQHVHWLSLFQSMIFHGERCHSWHFFGTSVQHFSDFSHFSSFSTVKTVNSPKNRVVKNPGERCHILPSSTPPRHPR